MANIKPSYHFDFTLTIDLADNPGNQEYLILTHVRYKNPFIARVFSESLSIQTNFRQTFSPLGSSIWGVFI